MKNIILSILLIAIGFGCYAQTETVRKKNFNLENGVALQGYDPVSYFTGKPQQGKKDLKFAYMGVTYIFVNAANLEAFKKDPAKYEPSYGGWCAYAMGAKGEKVEVDPETYKIVNGKLNLFYNAFFNNTLSTWNKDETHLKKNADANWVKINK